MLDKTVQIYYYESFKQEFQQMTLIIHERCTAKTLILMTMNDEIRDE